MKRLPAAYSVFLLLLLSLPVHAGVPMDTVQANVNKVLDVLRDPTLKAESDKETKKEKLRHIYDGMFDQVELSRRALAQNWNKLNLAQREEFVNLFRQVLEKAYIGNVLGYVNEKVVFDREVQISGTNAEIQTTIITSSKNIPVFYRVILKGREWKVYDVVIENVSLISNYRAQFNDILAKNTPEQMLEILRKKVKGQ